MVLCPVGRSLEREIDFLRAARERALWEPPGEIVFDAIEGLLGSIPAAPARGRRGARQASERDAVLLLEGLVTSERARAALASDARLWIVEHPRRVRVNRHLLESLQKTGVRWLALDPVILIAVLASPRLGQARSRWRHLLPAGTRLWIKPE